MIKFFYRKKERAKNNRTLTLVPEEIQTLKEKLLTKEKITSQTDFINKTLNGDILEMHFLFATGNRKRTYDFESNHLAARKRQRCKIKLEKYNGRYLVFNSF